jgi:hypothetical protein
VDTSGGTGYRASRLKYAAAMRLIWMLSMSSPCELHLNLATTCRDRSLHRLRHSIRVIGPLIRSPRDCDVPTRHHRICWHRCGRVHRWPRVDEEPMPAQPMRPAGPALSPLILSHCSLTATPKKAGERKKMTLGFANEVMFCSALDHWEPSIMNHGTILIREHCARCMGH